MNHPKGQRMANRHPVHENRLFFVKNAGVDGRACPLELLYQGTYNNNIAV